ncbi:disease resistance RPP8-like protein 3 [Senna tora]|uniref:Disease resistance RPP8-like protein 3 n=1 Tax=Senna tora TaxID=362788 RepID=A0A834SU03_9FABA|nr:disease resistance RPP8-like protein 3 [Senna tora]
MAEVAVSIVVEKLSEMVVEQAVNAVSVLHGVRDDVVNLKNELQWMQCFLREADAKQDQTQLLRMWVSEIRDLAFESEQLIESYLYKTSSSQTRFHRFFRSFHLYELPRRIQKLRSRIHDVSQKRETYGLVQGQGQNSNTKEILRYWRQPSPYSEEEFVIELEDDMGFLLSQLLTHNTRHRHVVSIVGMGGLGKTTLAKKLYNHTKIHNHFDCRAWVYVSKEFRRRDILQGILKDAGRDNEMERLREEDLVKLLHTVLDEKRYLIVLDDIWSMEVWDSLESAFPRGKMGSKVMLTTRNREVALYAGGGGGTITNSAPHHLRTLTEDESLRLLCNKAFPERERGSGSNSIIPPELENLARDIVVKCGGLPLAVVVVGGLLSRKGCSKEEWMRVVQNITWHLLKGQDRISGILALSYNDLPSHLKSCFLYSGLFPEAMNIHTKKLIRLWIAEGFLPQEGEETAEGVAEKCLNEMIGRCMIQVGSVSSLGRVKTIRIHDLLRDLSVSKGKDEYFLNIYHGSSLMDSSSSSSSSSQSNRSRRQAVHSCYESYNFLKHNAHHSRSLLFFNREYNADTERKLKFLQEKKLNFMYRKFKLLRVLELDGVRVVCLPNTIGDLIQLRYLGLRKTNLEQELPLSIGNLQNLQTLDLRYCCFLKRIPNVIWKMVSLRHLLLYTPFDSPDSFHLRLDTLSNLQSLPYIEAGSWIEDGLAKMSNLRQLGIYELSGKTVRSVLSIAQGLHHLHSLSLSLKSEEEEFPILMQLSQCTNLHKLSLNGKIKKLPDPHEFPPNLIKLTLHNSYLQMDSISKLERLPQLKMLVLGKGAYDWPELRFSGEGFSELRILRLNVLRELEEWRVEEGGMPRVEHIVINRCEKLKKIPEGVKGVNCLKEIKIIGMPVEFEHRLRTKDLLEFQHAPSVESTTDILANMKLNVVVGATNASIKRVPPTQRYPVSREVLKCACFVRQKGAKASSERSTRVVTKLAIFCCYLQGHKTVIEDLLKKSVQPGD